MMRTFVITAVVIWLVGVASIALVLPIAVWGWRGSATALRMVWLALLVDLAALGTLTVLAGASARESWTADVLVNGFLLVPVLAATQLGPRVGAAFDAVIAKRSEHK